RSFENLKDIYLKSVGGNTTLLLNLPPMKNGRIHETDVANLKQLGEFIENTFKYNLVDEAGITTIPPLDCREKEPTVLRTDDYETYFMNEAGTNKLMIKLNWIEKKKLNYLVLKEAIPFSQRVEKFKVCYEENGSMKECYNGTTIGYKKIIDLKGIQTDFLAIVIEDSRVAPVMSFVGVY
ncbi:alpha-fucosidase, partial [Ruminococcus sp. AM46-18]